MTIKEYALYSKTCILRERHYSSQLSYILELFEEAKKDFPGLTTSAVSVIQYGGERYKRTFGIEFQSDIKPEGYSEIDQVEYRL